MNARHRRNTSPRINVAHQTVLPAYSQGVYESDDETLDTALRRKFDYAAEKCELRQSTRVLEIGPGWGAFASHVLPRGVNFVGLTISEVSLKE